MKETKEGGELVEEEGKKGNYKPYHSSVISALPFPISRESFNNGNGMA